MSAATDTNLPALRSAVFMKRGFDGVLSPRKLLGSKLYHQVSHGDLGWESACLASEVLTHFVKTTATSAGFDVYDDRFLQAVLRGAAGAFELFNLDESFPDNESSFKWPCSGWIEGQLDATSINWISERAANRATWAPAVIAISDQVAFPHEDPTEVSGNYLMHVDLGVALIALLLRYQQVATEHTPAPAQRSVRKARKLDTLAAYEKIFAAAREKREATRCTLPKVVVPSAHVDRSAEMAEAAEAARAAREDVLVAWQLLGEAKDRSDRQVALGDLRRAALAAHDDRTATWAKTELKALR